MKSKDYEIVFAGRNIVGTPIEDDYSSYKWLPENIYLLKKGAEKPGNFKYGGGSCNAKCWFADDLVVELTLKYHWPPDKTLDKLAYRDAIATHVAYHEYFGVVLHERNKQTEELVGMIREKNGTPILKFKEIEEHRIKTVEYRPTTAKHIFRRLEYELKLPGRALDAQYKLVSCAPRHRWQIVKTVHRFYMEFEQGLVCEQIRKLAEPDLKPRPKKKPRKVDPSGL